MPRHTSTAFVAFLETLLADQPVQREVDVILDNSRRTRPPRCAPSSPPARGRICTSPRPTPRGSIKSNSDAQRQVVGAAEPVVGQHAVEPHQSALASRPRAATVRASHRGHWAHPQERQDRRRAGQSRERISSHHGRDESRTGRRPRHAEMTSQRSSKTTAVFDHSSGARYSRHRAHRAHHIGGIRLLPAQRHRVAARARRRVPLDAVGAHEGRSLRDEPGPEARRHVVLTGEPGEVRRRRQIPFLTSHRARRTMTGRFVARRWAPGADGPSHPRAPRVGYSE